MFLLFSLPDSVSNLMTLPGNRGGFSVTEIWSGRLFPQTVNNGAGAVPIGSKDEAVRQAVCRGPVDWHRRPVAAISSLTSSPAQHGKDLVIRQCAVYAELDYFPRRR